MRCCPPRRPADGAIVAQAPRTVTMVFTETPDPTLSSAQILDSGRQGRERGQGCSPSPARRTGLQIAMRPVGNGVYTVAWRSVSEVDGHYAAGSFSFGVGVSPAGAPSAHVQRAGHPQPVGRLDRRTLDAVRRPRDPRGRGHDAGLVIRGPLPGARVLLPLAWLLAAAGLVVGVLAQANAAGVSVGSLLSSETGAPLVREGIALAVLGVVVAVAAVRLDYWSGRRRRRDGRRRAAVPHARRPRERGRTWHWFNLFVQWAHVVSVGVWIGGLVWLLVDVARGVAGREERRSPLLGRRRRGAVRRARHGDPARDRPARRLGAPRPADLDRVGTALLWKLGLFVLLAGLGAWNRFVNVRDIEGRGARGLRRIVTAEVVVAAAIFGVTGVLAGLAPAAYAARRARPGPAVARRPRRRLRHDDARHADAHARHRRGEPPEPSRHRLRHRRADRREDGHDAPHPREPPGGRHVEPRAQEERNDVAGRLPGFGLQATYDVVVTVQTASTGTEIPLKVTPRRPRHADPDRQPVPELHPRHGQRAHDLHDDALGRHRSRPTSTPGRPA